jgi:hypothetical protein
MNTAKRLHKFQGWNGFAWLWVLELMLKPEQRKPKPGDLVSSADKDKKDDPNFGGDEHGDPLTKPELIDSDEEDEEQDRK